MGERKKKKCQGLHSFLHTLKLGVSLKIWRYLERSRDVAFQHVVPHCCHALWLYMSIMSQKKSMARTKMDFLHLGQAC